jgi:hypothetical protein
MAGYIAGLAGMTGNAVLTNDGRGERNANFTASHTEAQDYQPNATKCPAMNNGAFGNNRWQDGIRTG